jgi:hypothetical protein
MTITAILHAEPGVHLCDGCLALAAKVTLAEAQAAIAALDGDAGFQVAAGTCSSCQRNKIVVCALRQAKAG